MRHNTDQTLNLYLILQWFSLQFDKAYFRVGMFNGGLVSEDLLEEKHYFADLQIMIKNYTFSLFLLGGTRSIINAFLDI